ncbi:hypothetical protein BC828DRAFT_391673 [Blastocladiella britannica]|nr:hypothetical protein BC828DRAFT_391673 [Blastocladiella britannica]
MPGLVSVAAPPRRAGRGRPAAAAAAGSPPSEKNRGLVDLFANDQSSSASSPPSSKRANYSSSSHGPTGSGSYVPGGGGRSGGHAPRGPVSTHRPASSNPTHTDLVTRRTRAPLAAGHDARAAAAAVDAQSGISLRFAADILDDNTTIDSATHVVQVPPPGADSLHYDQAMRAGDAGGDHSEQQQQVSSADAVRSLLLQRSPVRGGRAGGNGGGGGNSDRHGYPGNGSSGGGPGAASSSGIAGLLSDPQVAATRIQSSWTTFSRLADRERDVFLQGILAQCGTKQVERICSDLQLRLSTTSVIPLHVHPAESHAMLVRASHGRTDVSVANLHTVVPDDAAPSANTGQYAPHHGDIPASSPLRKALDAALTPTPHVPLALPSPGSPYRSRHHARHAPPAPPPPKSPPGHHQPQSSSVLANANANMYRKLFPTAAAAAAASGSGSRVASDMHALAAARAATLESTLGAINAAAATPNVLAASRSLMDTMAKMLGAESWAVYSLAGDGGAHSLLEEQPSGGSRGSPKRGLPRRASFAGSGSSDSNGSSSFRTTRAGSMVAAGTPGRLFRQRSLVEDPMSMMEGSESQLAAVAAPSSGLSGATLSVAHPPAPTPRPTLAAGEIEAAPEPPKQVFATVQCSNWLTDGKKVNVNSIFGFSFLSAEPGASPTSTTVTGEDGATTRGGTQATFMTDPVLAGLVAGSPSANNAHVAPAYSDTAPVLNVYQAAASEYFTNACHEHYRPGTRCFLSAAVIDERGQVTTILELCNRVPPLAPYFDTEAEFVVRATMGTWALILREASAERERDAQGNMLRSMLQELQAMSSVNDLAKLTKLAETSVVGLVSAERVLISLDVACVDVDESVMRQLKMGEAVVVAHGMSIPQYRSKGIRNMLLVPILASKTKISGVIIAYNKLPDTSFFQKQDLDNLTSYAPLVAVLMSRAQTASSIANNLKLLETKLAMASNTLISQDCVVLRINSDMWITDAFVGTLAHPILKAAVPNAPLVGLIDTRHTVFHYDLHECLAHGTPRVNGEYAVLGPRNTASQTAASPSVYTEYSIFAPTVQGQQPDQSMPCTEVIVVFRGSSAPRRIAAVRSQRFGAREAVALKLVRDPTPLVGARERATVLLINLHAFSDAALMLNASQVAKFLAMYYDCIAFIVGPLGGVVLSSNSDRVTCVFGLPDARSDDAAMAIRSALALLSRLGTEIPIWLANLGIADTNVPFGIALASGVVSGGACSFANGADYVVVGEPVNLVGKIESAGRTYAAPLLLDRATHESSRKAYETREVDMVYLPPASSTSGSGSPTSSHFAPMDLLSLSTSVASSVAGGGGAPSTAPPGVVPLYSVIGEANAHLDSDVRTAFICYELGLGEYRNRNFDAALTYFRKCKSLLPDDGPAAVMIDRCMAAAEDPDLVPFEWDGLWRWEVARGGEIGTGSMTLAESSS